MNCPGGHWALWVTQGTPELQTWACWEQYSGCGLPLPPSPQKRGSGPWCGHCPEASIGIVSKSKGDPTLSPFNHLMAGDTRCPGSGFQPPSQPGRCNYSQVWPGFSILQPRHRRTQLKYLRTMKYAWLSVTAP